MYTKKDIYSKCCDARTYEDVAEYVENQSQGKCRVLSVKPEHTFENLGFKMNVWNDK